MMVRALVGPAEPPVEPPVTTCEIEIEGIPRPQLSHHRLRWSGTSRRARASMQIELHGSDTTLRLEGPRYVAAHPLRAGDCDTGKVVTLRANPLPALIQLFCPPPDIVLRCDTCEGPASERWYLPDQFPPITIESPQQAVTLRFKAVGYRPLHKDVLIYPGRNVVHVDLEPLRTQRSATTKPAAPCLADGARI